MVEEFVDTKLDYITQLVQSNMWPKKKEYNQTLTLAL